MTRKGPWGTNMGLNNDCFPKGDKKPLYYPQIFNYTTVPENLNVSKLFDYGCPAYSISEFQVSLLHGMRFTDVYLRWNGSLPVPSADSSLRPKVSVEGWDGLAWAPLIETGIQVNGEIDAGIQLIGNIEKRQYVPSVSQKIRIKIDYQGLPVSLCQIDHSGVAVPDLKYMLKSSAIGLSSVKVPVLALIATAWAILL